MATTEKRILRAQEVIASTDLKPQYLPPKLPGESPQKILSVERLNGTTTRIVTDLRTYELPHYHPMQMPCRDDGSTVDWRTAPNAPNVNQLAFGDLLKDPFDPTIHHAVLGIRTYGSADPFELIVQTVTEPNGSGKGGGRIENSRATMFKPFEPMRRPIIPTVSAESRSEKPVRGPYLDKRRPGVFYMFWVHPSGKGRWPVAMDAPFTRRITPDTYTTRPIGAKAWEQAIWNELEFQGDDDSMRHPYDPVMLRQQRSETWKAYSAIQRKDE